MCNFEKLSTNIDIMLNIYKLIDLKDQLQLCLVSDQLKCLFDNFVWKKRYQTLSIVGFAYHFVITNETLTDLRCLPHEEYQIFLQVYASSVERLIANYDAIMDLRLFPNLRKLEYKFAKAFTKENLRSVVENCPLLDELILKFCGTRYLNFIDLEEALDANLLQQITNLKRLVVIDRYPDKIKYRHFCAIITKTNLEFLKMNACIVPDNTVVPDDANIALKELQIEVPFNANYWPTNYTSFLNNFKNLIKLYIRINDVATDETLQIITNTCQKLETFMIHVTVFKDIQLFSIPSTVTDFTIVSCEGLTFGNLQQILTQYNIEKFTSVQTQYQGEFEDFPISPLIEVLNFDGVYTHTFPSAYRDNTCLKHLTWYDMKNCTSDGYTLREIPIETCTKLESLTIKSGFMPLAPLMHLKSLQKLAMPHSMPFLNWRYILLLLKHPSLVDVQIGDGTPPLWLTKTTHIPAEGFVTNVKNITISLRVFLSAIKFWLDLFSCNSQMRLVCQKFQLNEKIIRYIVTHERFPKTLRTIDISGFTISK